MTETKVKGQRGGRRPGAGRPSIAGKGAGRKSRQFSVTDTELAFLVRIGDGNRSAGFRLFIDWATGLFELDPDGADVAILDSVEGMRDVYLSRPERDV